MRRTAFRIALVTLYRARATGVPVELVWRGDDLADIATPVRRAAHRLVREGLTNLHRHSPGAGARVVVERETARVRIQVVNEPPPVRPSTATSGSGLGLVGAQERVRLLGGMFQAGHTGDGGFRMLAELPLDPSPEAVPAPSEPLPLGRRAFRRTWDDKRGIAAVLAAGLIAVPTLVVVLLNAVSQIVPGGDPYDDPAERAKVGMTRSAVTDLLGGNDALVQMAARSVETPVPAGADPGCLYAREWLDEKDEDAIVRYCFRGDRLAAIDRFPVSDG